MLIELQHQENNKEHLYFKSPKPVCSQKQQTPTFKTKIILHYQLHKFVLVMHFYLNLSKNTLAVGATVKAKSWIWMDAMWTLCIRDRDP